MSTIFFLTLDAHEFFYIFFFYFFVVTCNIPSAVGDCLRRLAAGAAAPPVTGVLSNASLFVLFVPFLQTSLPSIISCVAASCWCPGEVHVCVTSAMSDVSPQLMLSLALSGKSGTCFLTFWRALSGASFRMMEFMALPVAASTRCRRSRKKSLSTGLWDLWLADAIPVTIEHN